LLRSLMTLLFSHFFWQADAQVPSVTADSGSTSSENTNEMKNAQESMRFLQGICRDFHRQQQSQDPSALATTTATGHKAILFCTRDLEHIRPLSPVVYYPNIFQDSEDEEDENNDDNDGLVGMKTNINNFGAPFYLHFYPSSFVTRRLVLPDDYNRYFDKRTITELDCKDEEKPWILIQVSNTTTIRTKATTIPPPKKSIFSLFTSSLETTSSAEFNSLVPVQVSRLADRIVSKDVTDDYNRPILQKMEQKARAFHQCCLESFPHYYNPDKDKDHPYHHALFSEAIFKWRESREGRRCRKILEGHLESVSKRIATWVRHGEYDDYVEWLRLVSVVWGSQPARLANLLLVFGCISTDSYDEFFSCDIRFANIEFNLNIFQRGVSVVKTTATNQDDNDDGQDDLFVMEKEEDWQCHTCQIHQHPRWFASYVIAGGSTYTMAQPGCPHPNEDETQLPTVQELDRHLATSGSLIDKVGTRFTMNRTHDIVWETTEVLTLSQGQSLLFSPLWYHRVIPPPPNAAHATMTLVIKYHPEPGIARRHTKDRDRPLRNIFLLVPKEIDAPNTDKWICISMMDLYLTLSDPTLDVEQGLPIFPCTEDTVHSARDDFLFLKTLRQANQKQQPLQQQQEQQQSGAPDTPTRTITDEL